MDLTGTEAEAKSGMLLALREARAAGNRGEIPVGAAILAADGSVVAVAGNRVRELHEPTAHAEILAIRAACAAVGNERLPGHTIYVTLEPCPMCAAAISLARIDKLIYGAADGKSGGVENGACIFSHRQCHHVPQIFSGFHETECKDLLTEFFHHLRNQL